jgi:hypothetical protein
MLIDKRFNDGKRQNSPLSDFVLQRSYLAVFCGAEQKNQQERKAIFNSSSSFCP